VSHGALQAARPPRRKCVRSSFASIPGLANTRTARVMFPGSSLIGGQCWNLRSSRGIHASPVYTSRTANVSWLDHPVQPGDNGVAENVRKQSPV
jgi:hypothetical protein